MKFSNISRCNYILRSEPSEKDAYKNVMRLIQPSDERFHYPTPFPSTMDIPSTYNDLNPLAQLIVNFAFLEEKIQLIPSEERKTDLTKCLEIFRERSE